jgi:hypothetical protein
MEKPAEALNYFDKVMAKLTPVSALVHALVFMDLYVL